MDNSPLWDEALQRIRSERGRMPEYERVDVGVADAAERPSDAEYDRYVYLVGLFRELAYRALASEAVPFALQPVLFNSLLVRSNEDLAEIARVLGSDAEPFEAWAQSTAAGLESLWDEEQARVRRLRRHRRRSASASRTAAGLAPLYAGVPARERARAHGRAARGLPRCRRRLWLGGDEPLARRSGLPADALLARARCGRS